MIRNTDNTIRKFLLFLQKYMNQKTKLLPSTNKKTVEIAGRKNCKVVYIDDMDDIAEKTKCLIEEIKEADNLFNLFLYRKEDWSKNRMLCRDFDVLSDFLVQSNLSPKECAQVIFFLADRNIAGNFLDCAPFTFDFNALKKHDFKTLTPEALIQNTYVDENGEKCLSLTKEQQEELDKMASRYTIDLEETQQAHFILKEHFFEKQNSYTNADIVLIVGALNELKVNEKILKSIKFALEDDLRIRNLKEKRLIDKKNKNTPINFSKNYVTDNTDYQKTWEQLKNIVDLREMLPKVFLNSEQTIECVAMMFRVGIKREEIRKFLWNLEMANTKVEVNPVTKYVENYDKLQFYAQKQILYNELETLESYFQSLFIADDEEYVFWKNCLEEELNQYMKMIPGGYEYEIEAGIQKVKKRS